MYQLLRNILFKLEPERAHRLALKALQYCPQWVFPKIVHNPCQVMGLNFPNPIGLAAGMDKHGEYLPALGRCGFGFIEIGGITPKPQAGNPKPRLFRLPEQQAFINRMGFNNNGVDYTVEQLKQNRSQYPGIVGVNIAKNLNTPLENAAEDYIHVIEKIYDYVDYLVINISSPNTPGLRDLQNEAYLSPLLQALKITQEKLTTSKQRYVPLVIKVAPDLSEKQIDEAAALFLKHQVDGIIVTNTTVSRDGVDSHLHASQAGGLSGAPLMAQSTHVLNIFSKALNGKIPLIGLGGIMSVSDAKAKQDAGASLLQVYTGFIYQGPKLIHDIAWKIQKAGA